jgi:hypothetical protein
MLSDGRTRSNGTQLHYEGFRLPIEASRNFLIVTVMGYQGDMKITLEVFKNLTKFIWR